MQPHPRIRKTVKWVGLALTVLLVVVWVGSWFILVRGVDAKGRGIDLRAGVISYTQPKGWQRFAPTISIGSTSLQELSWAPMWKESVGFEWWYAVPLWIPVLVTAVTTGIAWRLDTLARRRERLTFCPTCHYSRTGLPPGGACPECGSPAPAVNP